MHLKVRILTTKNTILEQQCLCPLFFHGLFLWSLRRVVGFGSIPFGGHPTISKKKTSQSDGVPSVMSAAEIETLQELLSLIWRHIIDCFASECL